MKQLNFLQANITDEKPTPAPKALKVIWHLYVDGAARNNPGPAGGGIHVLRNGKSELKKGYFLGSKTNNQAEYLALLLGLYHAKTYVSVGEQLSIFADSQLLVRQMQGQYRVKDAELKKLQKVAFELLMPYEYSIAHVMRDDNHVADEMANMGIDKKVKPPQDFLAILNAHEISL